jgi:hypothetical protein
MVFFGKDLPRPSAYTAADKNKACKTDSRTGYQARKTERDPEGEKDRPRRAGRHLYRLSSALFRIPNIHHVSPPDEVHDCKDDDPNRIYEVPIKGNHPKAFALPRIDPTEEREDKCGA